MVFEFLFGRVVVEEFGRGDGFVLLKKKLFDAPFCL